MAVRKIEDLANEACDRVAGIMAARMDMSPDMLGFSIFSLDMTEGVDPSVEGSQPVVARRPGMRTSERMLWGFRGPSAAQLAELDADQKPIQFGKVDGVRTITSGDPRRLAAVEKLAAAYAANPSFECESDDYRLGINWLMALQKGDTEGAEILMVAIQEGIYDE